MQVQDASITRLVERIGEHYRTNISNRFIRPILLQLPFDNQSWDLLEDLTKRAGQGVHLDEMYRQIVAAAHFVAVVRRELLPGLRNRVGRGDTSSQDRVLRDMAVNNFASNLQVFADLVNELFIKLVEADKIDSKGRAPLYTQMPELSNIGRLLIGG
ncbi:MAG: hypothetical protein LBH35_04185 [Treponema sp.]|jgi:hypothetical protein|nr:hypothetical protein [Treponema sp.]